jgi:hypothetical protein
MYASGITYTSVSSVTSGGSTVTGAVNGVSLKAAGPGFDVVLGNDLGDLTYPAAFTSNREIPMSAMALEFIYNQGADPDTFFGINYLARTYWKASASLGGDVWSIWAPSNNGVSYAPYGTGNYWSSSFAVYDGVNLPTTARPNVVAGFWMYNETFNFGRIDPTEAAFSFRTETFFIIGADPYFEFHLPEIITSGGVTYRLDSTYVDRTTGIGFRQLVMDDIQLFSQGYNPAGGLYYAHFQYLAGADTTRLDLKSQNGGGVTVMTLGNYVDGASSFTYQTGELVIESGSIIVVASPRNVLQASNFNQTVGTLLCCDNVADSPTGDAILECQTTAFGFRPPSMSTAQKNALTPAAPGLVVFDNVLGKLCLFGNAHTWETVTSV